MTLTVTVVCEGCDKKQLGVWTMLRDGKKTGGANTATKGIANPRSNLKLTISEGNKMMVG